jgi:hypothetical protein
MPLAPHPLPGGAVEARALEALLRDLGPRLRRGETPGDPPVRCSTGIPEVDQILGGGFLRGRLGEIAGPASSGRTSLALALLATATRAGECAAVVDACDAFDPPSAEAAGVDLSHLLWVRAPKLEAALRSVERLLEARGFALVILDLASPAWPKSRRMRTAGDPRPQADELPRSTQQGSHAPIDLLPRSVLPRLTRAAASTATALVLLGTRRLAGTFSVLAVELDPLQPRFSGTPALLEGLEGRVLLVRNRSGPSHRHASWHLARIPHHPATAATESTASSRPSPSGALDVLTSTPSGSSAPRAANLQHSRRPRDAAW